MLFGVTITKDKASVSGQEAKSIEQFESLLRKSGASNLSSSIKVDIFEHTLSISGGVATFNGKATKDLKELQSMLRNSHVEVVNSILVFEGMQL